jgi:hypothetical protein
MTRSELTERILRQLNDSPTAPIFWSLGEIHDLLQDGQELLAEEADALRKTVYVPRRTGALFYSLAGLADDIMGITRIWMPDRHERLEPTTLTAMGHRNWLSWPGTQPYVWFPLSWHAFGVYPHAAQGSGVFEVNYVAWPTALLDDGDEPDCPEPDQDGLVLYGIYHGLMKQMMPHVAADYFQQFLARWTDATARNGVREFQARHWQRTMSHAHGVYGSG